MSAGPVPFRPSSGHLDRSVNLLFGAGDDPLEQHILHPTDFSRASEVAFHHALAIALRHGAQLTLMHAAGRRSTDHWQQFPSVREKMAQWQSAGSFGALGDRARRMSVSKLEVEVRDPVAAAMQYIEHNPVDMLVMATEGRTGLARLVRPSRAERLSRQSKLHTLFVPHGCRAFVAPHTGRVGLRRILLPVDPATDPRPAMLRAVRSAALLEDPDLEITLLHVEDGEESFETDIPQLPFCHWHVVRRSGDVVEQILEAAEDFVVDAIYMSTAWSRGFRRGGGTVTESVLAAAPCPVSVIPVDGPA